MPASVEHGGHAIDRHDIAAIDIARTLDRLQGGQPAARLVEAGGN